MGRTSKLQRREAKRDPKRRFVIFCEGKNTEPGYFNALRRHFRNALIDVQTIGGAGVPMTVATQAVNKRKEIHKSKDTFEKEDQVWAVFDRDNHPQHENAIFLCENKGVGVGRSNPCFEVWLILHIEDYQRPDGRDAVQKYLNKCIPEYDHKGAKTLDYPALMASVEEAEARAEMQLANRESEGVPYGVPSTTIFRLTRAIREAANSTS